MIKFSTAIALAEEQGACNDDMAVIRSMSGWEEFWAHPHAPYWSCWYVKDVIKGRWPDAENVIMKDPVFAFWYASNIKGRWPEAEEVIRSDRLSWCLYSYFLIRH